MSDLLQKQLELLRRKIARIEARPPAAQAPAAALDAGHEVETAAGRHWEIERTWPAHHRHGTADVGALADLPQDLLEALVNEPQVRCPPERWVFLDTETSGVSGGTGAFAFLVGAGAITPRGFELRQFFMRNHGEEPSLLTALSQFLGRFDLMVTYNGKAFDEPLLETRYRLSRIPEPFPRLVHVDLLFSARRLWRLALDSCRLVELEQRILGVERHLDPGGAAIPSLYFDYLRTGNFRPLLPVFTHNALDILSLACLSAIVPAAFRDPGRLKHAAEMVALARWFRKERRFDEALRLMRAALRRNLDEPLLWETLWQTATLERQLGNHDAAMQLWSELSTIRNPYQTQALERLAIYYEHRARNPAMALEMALAAQALGASAPLARRIRRLREKTAGARTPRLL